MKPLLEDVDAVLFDLDGTLVETDIDFPLMKREMMALAVQAGVISADVRDLDILAIVDCAAGLVERTRGQADAERLRAKAMNVLQDIELRHAGATMEIEFARDMLEELHRRRIKTGIVTRNCRAACELSLRITGIQVDVVICREDSNNHKPHPEPVLMALGRLNARPGNSVMVGDHTMDIQGGKSAGTKTIGFLRPGRPDDFFDSVAPDIVTRDLRGVLDAIIHSDS